MQIKLGDGGLEIRPETPLEGIELGKLYRDLQRQRHDCRVDTLRVALVLPLARPARRDRAEPLAPDPDSRAASDVTPLPEGLAP